MSTPQERQADAQPGRRESRIKLSPIVYTKPGALVLDDAASYVSLSITLFQKKVQQEEDFPKPIQLSDRRVGWLTAELDVWLSTRPRSNLLPPEGSGYGCKGKPQAASS